MTLPTLKLSKSMQTTSKAFDSANKMTGPLGRRPQCIIYVASASKAAGPFGQRAASVLRSYQQPVLYNLAVSCEIVKHVYCAEGLQPPSLSTVRSACGTLWSNATSVAFW
ncbi:hypothetical protein GYMLUDRAFT_224079 [Collybiopsis luxurians FD-317 M1]|uniref:Uncharacterized protein n=1 Tax=Collybiopsis luxurians FD-317 M1 TaxID=944289 RepID=A0A0D0CSK9_9AGAR|nr:hypothetical protein GYMLUDRAFT_224079 [Collybiopsis luxurians FD-317 M1]